VRHPLKSILRPVGRILIQLLCRCAFTHFNLYSVAEFAARLELFAAQTLPEDVLLSVLTDVKEMYTGMKHAVVLDSVAFMLDRCQATLRSDCVSISRTQHGPFVVGNCKAKGMLHFRFADLPQFVHFELRNLFFSLGTDVILQQVIGAAMGGFSSPGCAQCVASVAEFRCMTLFLSSGSIFANRFMDDTHSFVNLSAVTRSQQNVQILLYNLLHMYDHAGLEVELEAVGCASNVLQSTVTVSNGLACVFWNKNASFCDTKQQRVRRFLPCIAMSRSRQRAVISGLFHRMAAATIQPSIPLLLTPLLQLRQELVSLGYVASAYTNCLRSFVFAKKYQASFALWHSLYRQFRDCG
jgi:hypothetical protein